MALREIFKFRLKPADLCIMAAVLICAVCTFALAMPKDSAATVCVVEINGREFARYDMPLLKEVKILKIDNGYGKNTVVIDKNGACVTESDCADKSEIKSGKITKSGQSLICLPHRLTVRLEGAADNDGISW